MESGGLVGELSALAHGQLQTQREETYLTLHTSLIQQQLLQGEATTLGTPGFL